MQAEKTRQILQAIGLPKMAQEKKSNIVEHSAFILSFNPQHKQANWTSHMLLPTIPQEQSKERINFSSDPKLENKTAKDEDYKNSGYDRGHLVPRADIKWYPKAMKESFFYSNISPQKNTLNRQKWNQLEQFVRAYCLQSNHSLIVVTGPWLEEYLPKIEQGSEQLSIPRYYFKAILDLASNPAKAIAFLLPNNPCHEPLSAYALSVDEIEQKLQLDLWSDMEDSIESAIEARYNFDDWNTKTGKSAAATIEVLDKKLLPKDSYTSVEVQNHYGQKVVICGQVASNFKTKKGNVYLNLDAPYPKQAFSINIPTEIIPNFDYTPEIHLKNKAICVDSKVYEYKSKATSTIKNAIQIQLIEKK